MPTSFKRLELLEQQIYHAHRGAVAHELERRGLREVNPMILAILKHVEQAGAERFSQRGSDQLRRIRWAPTFSIQDGSIRATVRANSRDVSTSSPATIHRPAFLARSEPG